MYYGQVHKSRFLTPNEIDLIISLINQNQYYYHVFESNNLSERRVIIFSNVDIDFIRELEGHVSVVYLYKKTTNYHIGMYLAHLCL